MRLKPLGAGMFLLFMLIASYPFHASGEEPRIMSVQELKTRLDAGEKVTLINPLSDILFNEGNIPGSVNIPLGELRGSDKLPRDRDMLLVSYCLGPKSSVSREAALLLAEQGYRNVRWLKDGTAGWVLFGYPLEYGNALPRIPVPGLSAVLLQERLQEVLVLDIRPPGLYQDGWIKGSRRVPLDDLSRKYMELPRGNPIVVVDHAGNHVIVAARFLQDKGYDVLALQGGILSWTKSGYPLEKSTLRQATSRVETPLEN